MGESQKAEISVYSPELESFSVETPGGRMHIRWDNEASATANAQLAFFAEFLATAGLYESWVSSCPLTYSSGNASQKRDILGTWFLSILAGHHRYSHITGLRGDGVSPQILGMSKIVSEDSLRRALARMSAEQSQNWLRPQLLASVQGALDTPWILDIDTTVKTLYGKQSGAEVSYNAHKPGRPSHALHTYFVSHLRMVLDVVVCPGKQHSSAHAPMREAAPYLSYPERRSIQDARGRRSAASQGKPRHRAPSASDLRSKCARRGWGGPACARYSLPPRRSACHTTSSQSYRCPISTGCRAHPAR